MVSEAEYLKIKDYLQRNPVGSYQDWKATQPKTREKKEKTEYPEEFIVWWCLYPATSKFEYKGRKFNGSRVLRDKQDSTYKCYQQARKHHTAEELLHALKVEIEERKIESYKHKDPTYNAFHYMKATCAYLNSGRYKYYIGEEIPQIKESPRVQDMLSI